MISTDDYVRFVDDALAAMVTILEELGDDHAGRRLSTSGANAPYAVVTHCLGVVEYWAGHVVRGRPSSRDRAAEFRASGPVADLVAQVHAAREQLATDARQAEPSAPPLVAPDDLEPEFAFLGRTQGAALVHVYEELCQHLGQLEVTRDVLLAQSEQG